MMLGLLISIGAAYGEDHPYGYPGSDHQNSPPPYDQNSPSQYGDPGYGLHYGSASSSQMLTQPDIYNYHYDWLSPGSLYWQYSYPEYYRYNNDYYWWHSHYPTHYYTTPITYYYNWYPAGYSWDPWYAANVYGLGTTTYYYSSSWSYRGGGFFLDP